MLTKLAAYGALSSKVRCLWGQRLRLEDYSRLASMGGVADIAVFLEALPRWRGTVSGLDPRSLSRAVLEDRLRLHKLEESLRLLPYLSEVDKELLSFPVLDVELHQIMRYLTCARAGRADKYSYSPPVFLKRYSKLDYAALSEADSYEQLLAAVSKTSFAPVLAGIKTDRDGFPQFTVVESALLGHYLKNMYKSVKERGNDGCGGLLLESIGMRGDLYNITVIMRVLRYYPALSPQLPGYLIPVSAHLRPAFIRAICAASGAEAALELLKGSRYGKFFQSAASVEDACSAARYEFCRKRLRDGVPSVLAPLSFLYLSEIELENIIHIIECVRYGVDPGEAMSYVAGRD